ncbi:MAG: neutral/alkaline non-lysosomal ceramidase N-terminal domain-containing protein [bacterium]|nr:neutral/alkaline non-lysosomal ceramidase N-terminal domain-containing protein [bacterium]
MTRQMVNAAFSRLAMGLCCLCLFQAGTANLNASDFWQVGFAKSEITPTRPIRLSGYASREQPFQSVADPLHVRAMVLSPNGDANARRLSHVLVSIDSILVTSQMTVEIALWTESQYEIPRSQLVLSSTHSHAAPHLAGGLENLFRVPLSSEEATAIQEYTDQVLAAIKRTIEAAFAARTQARIEIGEAQADFAINRRVLREGKWTGFGEQPAGPVDHRVRVMLAVDENERILGGSYLYACHCTTLNFDQVSGDWAGISANRLEAVHPDCIFLPVIGCGADANPNPRGTYELAVQHAAKMVDAVEAVCNSASRSVLKDFPQAHFGYAGLAPEQPTDATMNERLASDRPNDRRWAEHMQKVKQEMGRLPETYPMPIHTWQFGNALSWVFLGGEVVVDYQFQIEKELPTRQTWVAAYTDDVFAYVASESMRAEGGYEVDSSMIYYLQPGRWQSGTQTLILRRVREIFDNQVTESGPLTAEEALASIQVPEEFQVELVASDPLIRDPINLAFGLDGSVWVVEMADYPLGVDGGGRIKRLRDTDGDGSLDQAELWLTGLDYPTSVLPWQDGAIIIAAPDVIFAADRDGDGTAEVRETWLTGIHPANPQHRASGFEIGLDGWLHFAAGDHTETLTSSKNGVTYEVRGHDVAWNPATGEVRNVSGTTQFIRARDAFGNWFGNSNSLPIYQYVIEERYRKEDSIPGGVSKNLLTPAVAPPVYPRSQVVDRFNDLFALNRFTSACSSIIGRVPGLGADFESVGLICEPVHNLVARIQLQQDGSAFSAIHHPQDGRFDFFTSTDPWSRPVRAVNAPDGSVWIVDMVRKVIEHPEWIPTAWQQRIDLRAGSQQGRIYRVYHRDHPPTTLPNLETGRIDVLEALQSQNGALRDAALLDIMWSQPETSRDSKLAAGIRDIASTAAQASVRISAYGCLQAKGWLSDEDLLSSLRDADPRVVRFALTFVENRPLTAEIRQELLDLVERDLGPAVDLQWVLTLSALDELEAETQLKKVAARSTGDEWIGKALSLIRQPNQAFAVLSGLVATLEDTDSLDPQQFLQASTFAKRLWQRSPAERRQELVQSRVAPYLSGARPQLEVADLLLLSLVTPSEDADATDANQAAFRKLVNSAQRRMLDDSAPESERVILVNLLGNGWSTEDSDLERARQLLSDKQSPRIRQAVIQSLRSFADPLVASLLLEGWTSFNSQQRSLACSTLLSRRNWTEAFINELESGKIQPNDLDPGTVQRLRSYHDRSLRSRCLAVFGKPTPRTEVVDRYVADTPSPNLQPTSAELFREHCAACHSSVNEQPMIGPPLENLGHWTIDQWITAILDPNRNVEPKYKQTLVLTEDDQLIAGLLQNESANELVLAQTDGTLRSIPKSSVVEVKEGELSLMPEGFEQKLSPAQMAELLGYLRNGLGANQANPRKVSEATSSSSF